MKTIEVCIGSACHLKGSYEVIEALKRNIEQYDMEDQVDLKASFCLGNCMNAVSVKMDGKLFSLLPETTDDFFVKEVKSELKSI